MLLICFRVCIAGEYALMLWEYLRIPEIIVDGAQNNLKTCNLFKASKYLFTKFHKTIITTHEFLGGVHL